jgi:hypothetical protein
MKDKPNWPLAGLITSSQLIVAQVKILQRAISRRFEFCNDVHSPLLPLTAHRSPLTTSQPAG